MIKTFPNLKVRDVNGDIIYMDSFLDIQPYYLKIHDKGSRKAEDVQKDMNG